MLKVYINPSVYQDTVEIAFVEDRPNGEIAIARPMQLEMEIVKEGDPIAPTLVIPRRWAGQFLQAMAEALDQQGVKTDKDAKIAGTLEATRFHLEDLRYLLKLKKP